MQPIKLILKLLFRVATITVPVLGIDLGLHLMNLPSDLALAGAFLLLVVSGLLLGVALTSAFRPLAASIREASKEGTTDSRAGHVSAYLLLIPAALLLIYAIGFLATGGDYLIYRFWAPKQEAARRAVFVETPSYVQGKITHLTELQLAYEQSEGAQRATLRTVILREAAQIDNDKLPDGLVSFISTLKGKL